MRILLIFLLTFPLTALQYQAPAGERKAAPRPGAVSVLPGGRMLHPFGRQYATGPGPFGLTINANGTIIVTANGGPDSFSLTVLHKDNKQRYTAQHVAVGDKEKNKKKKEEEDEWQSVFMGLAFADNHKLFVSEGNSGNVRLIDPTSGKVYVRYLLNGGGFSDSYSGDLAYDSSRKLLYVLDQANFRLVTIDVKKKRIASSQRVGRLPFALALAPDGKRVYVTNIGMFEYKPIPGADPDRARETGLPFPAFGFPSPEAVAGARRQTAQGPVDVPGLGEPNVPESNSLCVVNVENPAEPRIERFVRTGKPFGKASLGGSSPSGVLATKDRIYVANGHNDSVTVIDAASLEIVKEIPIRIKGLESFRGVLPEGMAYHPASGWLLVAESGINAVGIIDTKTLTVLGHVPAAWFPTRVAIHEDTVYVTSAKGHGTGPNANRMAALNNSFQGKRRRGAITVFPLPSSGDLPRLTNEVMKLNGFLPRKTAPAVYPKQIRYVVLIVKENRTYDEVFGDMAKAANGPLEGAPMLARFGEVASPYPEHGGFRARFSLRSVNVTPNHHEMARRWAFSDNFYADSEVSVDGHHWLVGSYPNAWTESTLMASYGGQKDFRLPTTAPGRLLFTQSNSSLHPEEQLEAGAIWHHLERHGISFRNFGEGFELAGVDEGKGLEPTGARVLTNVPMPDPLYRNTSRNYPQFNMNIPDQYRATQFIKEIDELYVKGGKPFPRFLFIHLPNDHMTKVRPQDGYPFKASYVADNDYALGRIVSYLSKTPWWREMAIFITEDDAAGGVDHVDSHRTVFLAVSPYARRNYASHRNSSFPGLLKTIFGILELPPLNLFDASATDLSDCFTEKADFTPYEAIPVLKELFDAEKVTKPLEEIPQPAMDDPSFLQQEHNK